MAEEKLTGKALRLKTIELIEAGGATMESLIEATGVKDKRAMGRVFSELRIMERYPIADDKGVYSLVDEETYEKSEAAKKTTGKKKKATTNPQGVRQRAINNLTSKVNAFSNATTRMEKNPGDELLILKASLARTAKTIAEVELRRVKVALAEEFNVTVEEIEELDDLNTLLPDKKEGGETEAA